MSMDRDDDGNEPEHSFPSPLNRIATRSALKKNTATANVWFLQSPKNNKRLTITGDLPFFQAVILEGQVGVIGYDINPEPINARHNGEDVIFSPAMHVFTESKKLLWIDFMHSPLRGRQRKNKQFQLTAEYASTRNISYRVITDADARKQQVLFDNWMMFCASISRCKDLRYERILKTVYEHTKLQSSTTLKILISSIDEDPALIFASVALGFQKGLFKADLEHSLFGIESVIGR